MTLSAPSLTYTGGGGASGTSPGSATATRAIGSGVTQASAIVDTLSRTLDTLVPPFAVGDEVVIRRTSDDTPIATFTVTDPATQDVNSIVTYFATVSPAAKLEVVPRAYGATSFGFLKLVSTLESVRLTRGNPVLSVSSLGFTGETVAAPVDYTETADSVLWQPGQTVAQGLDAAYDGRTLSDLSVAAGMMPTFQARSDRTFEQLLVADIGMTAGQFFRVARIDGSTSSFLVAAGSTLLDLLNWFEGVDGKATAAFFKLDVDLKILVFRQAGDRFSTITVTSDGDGLYKLMR